MSQAREKSQDLAALRSMFPDFPGYQYPKQIQASDQIFRQHVTTRLQKYRCTLAILRAVLNKPLYRVEQSGLETLSGVLGAMISLMSKAEVYINTDRALPDESSSLLAEIYRTDLKLVKQLSTLDKLLKELEASIAAKQAMPERIRQISVLLDDLRHGLEAHHVLVQKINGTHWVLDLWL
jgi:hypothetical protein